MKKSRGYSFKLASLLSGTGVAIAPAAMIGAASVMLIPAAALAANECAPVGVDPSLNGATADAYTCAAANFSATGITYATDGALTITGPASGTVNTGAFGVNLSGTGTDSITWTQTGGTITGTGAGDSTMDVETVSGAINLTVNAVTGSSTGMVAAIDAFTSTGNVAITTTGTINGRQYGIRVTHGTSGTDTLNVNGAVSINATDGIAAILVDKATSTSATTINVGTGSGTVSGSNDAAILVDSLGTQTITIASGRSVTSSTDAIGTITLDGATGTRSITNAGTLSGGNTGVVVRADGTTFTLTNSGTLTGLLDLDDISGNSTVTNSGTWTTAGINTFAAGTATLTNSGTMTVSGDTTLSGLDTFNNSGTIALGTNTLTAANVAFNATGSSLVTLTVGAEDHGQLLLPGATVTGVTNVRVSGVSDTTLFSEDPLVLVDVTGGTVADGAFVLDPASTGALDGSITSEGSLFTAAFGMNDANQFVVFSAPNSLAFEYVPALHEVISTWHTTTDLVTGRNADLGGVRERGMWIRVIGDRSERDFNPTFTSADNTITYDAGYSHYTGAAIVGFDVLAGASASGNYLLGIHGGLVRTRMEMDNSDTTDDMDGVTLGVYGGLTNGPLSFDGTVNANLLNLDHNEPTMGDTSTNVISIGARGEVGYMWPMAGGFYVQPIVTGAFVRTSIDELFPKAYEITYDEVESARAAIGLRLGADAGTAMGPIGFWLTGRLWKEFKDEANVTFSATDADDFVFVDDLGGEFQELNGGVSLDAGPASFFLSAGAKFYEEDEFDNYNGSVGVRWRW